MSTIYKAWVPSVTGKLSFSQIGRLGKQACDFPKYSPSELGCKLHCISDRTEKCDDSIFKLRSLLRKFGGHRAIFEIEALAPSIDGDQPVLTGFVRCYIEKPRRKIQWPQILKESQPRYWAKFCLKRDGELDIFDFRIDLNRVKISENDAPLLQGHLVPQLYFYIKDTVHRHRHHAPEDDTFIEPTNDVGRWKELVTYQLGKRVIKRPIDGTLDSYQSAQGILAYLEAFQQSQGIEVYTEGHLKTIGSSLAVEHARMKDIIVGWRWWYGMWAGLYVFLAARLLNWDQALGFQHSLVLIGYIAIMLFLGQKTQIRMITNRNWYLGLVKFFSAFDELGLVTLVFAAILFTSLSLFFLTYSGITMNQEFFQLPDLRSWIPRDFPRFWSN